MRKNLIFGSFLLIPSLISSFTFASTSLHLEKLKSKFPYGLLGDDYGVLTMDDLARNACNVRPKPFLPSRSSYYPYEYWQCFESKSISFDCDSNGERDEYEGVMGLVVVKVFTQQAQHDYVEHRLWPIRDCKSFIKDAAALLKGSRYACISGSFISGETSPSGRQSMSWQFEKIKTKKGCEGRGCDFTREFKRDHCPDLKQ